MQSKSMACALLWLSTSLAFAQRGDALESTSDPTKFVPAPAPAGTYTQDRAHSSLILRVDHLGFSNFTARFTHFDIQLQLNPAHLNESGVTVKIDPNSLESCMIGGNLAENAGGPRAFKYGVTRDWVLHHGRR